MMAGFMNTPSVYDLGKIHSMLAWDRSYNIPTLNIAFENIVIYSSPLIWAGVLFLVLPFKHDLRLRVTAIILLLVQTLVLLLLIIFDPRYYGGLLQGLVVTFILSEQKNRTLQKWSSRLHVTVGAVIFVLPWLALQVFYAWQFFPVALGIGDKTTFYRGKVAFFDDFRLADRIIPKNAIFLYNGTVRLNAVYSPRPVFWDEKDLPKGRMVFLFQVNKDSCKEIGNFYVGKLQYENTHAITETFRNPFRVHNIGKLKIYSLEPKN
jgi:hypothetical protein